MQSLHTPTEGATFSLLPHINDAQYALPHAGAQCALDCQKDYLRGFDLSRDLFGRRAIGSAGIVDPHGKQFADQTTIFRSIISR
jgi:hypothetical protein